MTGRHESYTDHFGLAGRQVPFEDLDVFDDTRLFIDPHRIRQTDLSDGLRCDAVESLDSFLGALTERVLSGAADPGGLLTNLEEPRETHIGLSESGYNGRAASSFRSSMIWQALTGDARALFVLGILRRLEDLPLFVQGVANDITSDIATRIVFDVLARYTIACTKQFPELLSKETVDWQKTIWDSRTKSWRTRVYGNLPAADGRVIVLIPKGWCDSRLLGWSDRFFNVKALEYAQRQNTTYDAMGHLHKPTKKSLKQAIDEGHHAYNCQVASEAFKHGEDLIARFWVYVDQYERDHCGDN